jgi:hypothetical protein
MTNEEIKFNAWINNIPYKWIIIREKETGRLVSSMDKPKLKYICPLLHVSGGHIFQDKPEENHYDHYCNGSEWKEYNSSGIKLSFSLKLEAGKVIFTN